MTMLGELCVNAHAHSYVLEHGGTTSVVQCSMIARWPVTKKRTRIIVKIGLGHLKGHAKGMQLINASATVRLIDWPCRVRSRGSARFLSACSASV